MKKMRLNTPLSDKTVRNLHIGDQMWISGELICARDPTHKRLVEQLEKGEDLPIDIHGRIIYYAGPAPTRPGHIIGPIGPTTSGRLDPFTAPLLKHGLKGMIGKGYRSPQVRDAIMQYGAVYFIAVGGAAALIARCVRSFEVIAYPDLGCEALFKLIVEDLPVIVAMDTYGEDLYEVGMRKYAMPG